MEEWCLLKFSTRGLIVPQPSPLVPYHLVSLGPYPSFDFILFLCGIHWHETQGDPEKCGESNGE